jgi:hypothetical protein
MDRRHSRQGVERGGNARRRAGARRHAVHQSGLRDSVDPRRAEIRRTQRADAEPGAGHADLPPQSIGAVASDAAARIVSPRRGPRRCRSALERRDVAVDRHRPRRPLVLRAAAREVVHPCRHADPGLADDLRGARAVLRQVRADGRRQRKGGQHPRHQTARRQLLRAVA